MTDALRRRRSFGNASLIDQSDRPNREILAQVVGALSQAGLPDVVLVGAMARDIWLDELGRPSERATNDVDFGFGVRDWASYQAIRSLLLDKHGFRATKAEHQLTFAGHLVDLVPFGAIEGKDRSIVWPEGRTRMNLLGFDEAATRAEAVKLPGDLLVRVATLPALLILKLMAWHDRKHEKDAADFWSLLSAALASNDMQERLYEDPVYEAYAFDRDLAASGVLGRDAREILEGRGEAIAVLAPILAAETDSDGSLVFVSKGAMPLERKLEWLRAFAGGLMGEWALSASVLDAIAAGVDRLLQRTRAELSGRRTDIDLDVTRRGVRGLEQKLVRAEVAKAIAGLDETLLEEVQNALNAARIRLVPMHVPFIENRMHPILDRARAGLDLEFGSSATLFHALKIRLARDLRIAAAGSRP